MRWISSTELQKISGKEFEMILPELIRKLIIASCTSFPDIHVPIGDSIYKPGWDGQCNSDEKCEYVSQGISFWEWGRDEDFLGKCNEEYKKRTIQTDQSVRCNSTFVFVTPKRWVKPKQNKETKIKTFQGKNEWKDIKIYDADDLEMWIELHPAIGLWLARRLRLVPPKNIESATDFWNIFTDAKEFTFSSELIIAGRNKQKSQIQHFLNGDPGNLEVQASSDSEAIAFIIASAIDKGKVFKEVFFNRAIIIKGKEELREITSNHENRIIIYNSQGNEKIENPTPELNHILNTLDFKINTSGVSLQIPTGDSFAKSLEGLGLEWENAYSLSKQCGRSFSALRRILTDIPGRISWTENKNLRQLIPIFLLQKIDTRKKGDRQLITKLAQKSFEEYESEIREWSLISDNPVYLVSNYWRVVSPYDLFFALARFITTSQLRLFEEALMEALCEIDPALELEPNMRMASALFNKETNYSNKCKEGICQTLILISVFGERAGINVELDIMGWVDSIVKRLLSNQDLSFWQSVESKIHLLAEASPDSFLTSLEEIAINNPIAMSSMFNDEDYDLFSPTYHTHILWALESLAWDSHYFSNVVLVLARLVELDKGGKTANRPLNSLRHIFLLWLPQTYVSQNNRGKVIETLIKQKGDVAFKLLLEIAPKSHDTGHYTHKLLWRNREIMGKKVTRKEWAKGISFVCEKLIEVADNRIDRWIEIIDLMDDFYNEDRTKLIDTITIIPFDGSSEALIFREKLRQFIWSHETYSAQDWAINSDDLERLKAYHSSLLSNDVDRYYWYFNVDTIESSRTSSLSSNELIEKTNELRQEALSKINLSMGIDGIVELSNIAERPWLVGRNLASITQGYQNNLLAFLEKDSSDNQYRMAAGYFYRSSEQKDFAWIENIAKSINQEKSSKRLLVHFFLSLSPSAQIWKLLEHTSKKAYQDFWKIAYKNDWGLNVTPDELNQCIKILNQFERFSTSLNLIRSERKVTPIELIIETLKGLATHTFEENVNLQFGSYTIIELFKRLDEEGVDEKTMQLLEWYYISILNNSRRGRPIKYLYKALKESPSFFSELISWSYIPETNPPEEEIRDLNPDFVQNRAKNAHELLESWVSIPGTNSAGGIEMDKLKSWIKESIEECAKRDRESKGYYEIGKVFGKSRETQKNWPAPEICELIEEIDHKEMNDGFITGIIYGSRVRASIRPANGANPDRARASKYFSLSEKLSFEYPKVSRLLKDVSKSYEGWAEYMDRDKKQRDLDY
ncbi:hypothetical protein ABWH96_11775 [Marivirga tractuosa]|uniref:hypothetical protein n=1 Tax=Marivirga tractuosa TaxID=1006 RepID=UPI0035CEE922